MQTSKIQLTQSVQKGGCAAKIAAFELRKILSQVRFPATDLEMLVDGSQFDDAAIYKVSEDLALVQTLDFFTPIVDSPYIFGKVAAANAISDVFAMGGFPKTAMAILAFPLSTMDSQVAVEVLQGASDIMSELKINFVGGHSIDDDTLKFGLSVTGYVHPKKIWQNSHAKVGDDLILTKGLGTGTITAALKRQHFTEIQIQDCIDSMTKANNVLSYLNDSQAKAIHAATDITGFGLLGHAYQMAKASNVSLEINFAKLPQITNAMDCLKAGFLTKAHRTNYEYTKDFVQIDGLDKNHEQLLFDPQTSGGLLLSVESEASDEVIDILKANFPATSKIGKVTKAEGKSLFVKG